jgi:hypothetical protein
VNEKQAVEGHPTFHDWYIKGDIVTERKGRRIKTIQRFEGCQFCPTLLISTVDVATWQMKKRYKYVKGVRIIRMTKEEYTKAFFLKTTDLDEVTVARLKNQK